MFQARKLYKSAIVLLTMIGCFGLTAAYASTVDIFYVEGSKALADISQVSLDNVPESERKELDKVNLVPYYIGKHFNLSGDFVVHFDDYLIKKYNVTYSHEYDKSKNYVRYTSKVTKRGNKYSLSISLSNSTQSVSVLTLQYDLKDLTQSSLKTIAVNAANSIAFNFTGKQYYFNSKIMFVAGSSKKPYKKGNNASDYLKVSDRALYVMDYDGEKEAQISPPGLFFNPVYFKNSKSIAVLDYEGSTSMPRKISSASAESAADMDSFFDLISKAPEFKGKSIFNISISPDGKKVALVVESSGGSDIYKVTVKDFKVSKLTSGGINTSPSWSGDGKKIAFSSNKTGRSNIYIMTEGGRQVHRVTNKNGNFREPKWSPYSSKIVYTRIHKGSFSIEYVDIFTHKTVTLHKSFSAEKPQWSPCGLFVIFSFQKNSTSGSMFKIVSVDNPLESRIVGDKKINYLDPHWFVS